MKHRITYTKTFDVDAGTGGPEEAKRFIKEFMETAEEDQHGYFEGFDFDIMGESIEHIPPEIKMMTLTIRVVDDTNDGVLELLLDVPFDEPDDLMHASIAIHSAIQREFPGVRQA